MHSLLYSLKRALPAKPVIGTSPSSDGNQSQTALGLRKSPSQREAPVIATGRAHDARLLAAVRSGESSWPDRTLCEVVRSNPCRGELHRTLATEADSTMPYISQPNKPQFCRWNALQNQFGCSPSAGRQWFAEGHLSGLSPIVLRISLVID